MASKKNTTPVTTTPAVNTANTANKADAIRQYANDNPGVGPAAIAKALTAQGIEVNASRVSTVLRGGNGAKGGLNVDSIKLAAEFVKSSGMAPELAKDTIKAVGNFIDRCGGAAKAVSAIEAFESVSAALK